MGGAIMGKAAGEIAGLQEIVGEGLDHIVERLLALIGVFANLRLYEYSALP